MSPEATPTESGTGADSGGPSSIARLVHGPIAMDLLDVLVGHPANDFEDTDAEIVGILDDPPLSFDVQIEVECGKPLEVVNRRSLDQFDVDGVRFHSLNPVDGGVNMQLEITYRDTVFGFSFFIPNED